MSSLNTEPNLADPDDFYAELLEMLDDKDEKQSREIHARLILLLSNHIGDREILSEAMKIAAKAAG